MSSLLQEGELARADTGWGFSGLHDPVLLTQPRVV